MFIGFLFASPVVSSTNDLSAIVACYYTQRILTCRQKHDLASEVSASSFVGMGLFCLLVQDSKF